MVVSMRMEATISRLGLNQPSRRASSAGSSHSDGCQPLQIEQPADHQGFLPNVFQRPPEESAESMLFFGLAPEFLDLLPGSLTPLVAGSPLPHAYSPVHPAASPVLYRHMGLDAPAEQRADKLLLEEPLVASERVRLETQLPFFS